MGNLTPGGDGGFAILNIEDILFGGLHDAGLRTPVMDFSGETMVLLDFDSDYANLSSDTATVRVSNDNGATWIPVWMQTEGFNGHVSLDISTEAAGNSEVIVEFRYQGSLATWWEVDDVYIGDPFCDSIPGGVVAGFAFNESTLDALIGAEVISAEVATQTLERSCDPENAGLYWTFQPTTTDPEDVEFSASMVKYSDDSAVVSVVQDAVTQQDFYLGSGHLVFDPIAFEVTMSLVDAPYEEVLTISNDGTGAADLELFEVKNFIEQSASQPIVTVRKQAASNEEIQISVAGTKKKTTKPSAVNSMPNADIEFIIDDGTVENNIGIGGTSEFLFLNRFTPDPGAFPFTIDVIQVYFDDTVSAGDEIILAVYENTFSNENPAVGANLLASFPETVQVTSSWNNYPIPGGVIMSGPGDVLIGVVALEVPGTTYFPAALDQTLSQERSWAGWWLSSPFPADLALPPDDTWGMIDDLGFPGNWMIRGIGSAGGSVVVWLNEDPISGTVAASDSIDVTLTFDPSLLEQPGDYFADLQAQHDTPYVYDNIPVTLHLLRPETWGTLKGTIYALEACDVNPTPIEGAAVNIYDAEGVLVASLTSGMDGSYSWSLAAGNYDIEVLLDGYGTTLAEDVVLPADTDKVADIELRLLAPCLSVVPESLEQWLGPDQTATQILSLINSGAGEASFELVESEVTTPTHILSEGSEEDVMPPGGGWESIINGDAIQEWAIVDAVTYPDFVNFSTLIDESFEDTFPPLGWTEEITNSNATWEQSDYTPHSGTYKVRVPSDDVQDEWLMTPEFNLSEGTLSVWSYGNKYWCRDTYDNCDLNVWLVVNEVGGGDDIFLKNLDEDWVENRVWAQSTIDLAPYLPDSVVRIGFQYLGDGGVEAGIDDVSLDGVLGGAFDIPWLSEDPILGSVPADSTLDVDVTLDSTGMVYDDYFGLLEVKNALNPDNNVPLTLHVIPAPEAFDLSVTTPEDTPIEITLTATDPEGDLLTYSIVDASAHGTLEFKEGELPILTYVPEDDYYGEDSFSFKANDGVVDSNLATVSIEVISVNYPPQANDDYYEADENVELTVPASGVLANDVESDPQDLIMAVLDVEPAHGMVTLNEDGSFSYMPDAGFLGEDSFTYNMFGIPPEMLERSEYSDEATVTIMVNTKPVADDQSLTIDEDTPLAITLTADYITPGPSVWTVEMQPTHGVLNSIGENLAYVPDQDWYGIDSLTFSVNDGMYDSNSATITIEVLPVDDSPNAVDDCYVTEINVALEVLDPGVLANDYDVDPFDELLAEKKTDPLHGTLVVNQDGSFTYTPDPDFYGVDSFEYYTFPMDERESGLFDWATVNISVGSLGMIFIPMFID